VSNSSSSESDSSSDEQQTAEDNLEIINSINDVPELLQFCLYN